MAIIPKNKTSDCC